METWNDLIKRMSDMGFILINGAKSFKIDFDADAFQSVLEIQIDGLNLLLRATKTKRKLK